MSFWLDWWLLIVEGIIIVFFVQILLPKIGIKFNKYNMKWAKWTLYIIWLGIFYILSVGLFCGFTMGGQSGGVQVGPTFLAELNDRFFGIAQWFYSPYYVLHPAANSTEFMFSSGQEWIRSGLGMEFYDLTGLTQHPFALFLGIIVFCSYPFWLKLGVWLGELMFGSCIGKKGMWEMGWIVFMIVTIIAASIIGPLSVQNSLVTQWIPTIASSVNIALATICLDLVIAVVCIGDFFLILRNKK